LSWETKGIPRCTLKIEKIYQKGDCTMRIDPKKMELYLARACMSETDLRNGTSPQTLLRIRRGMEVKPKTAGRIARALGVDVTDIIDTNATAIADNAN